MKIIKIDNCSNCPHKAWDRKSQKRICRHNRANRPIETAVTTIPDWCELEDSDNGGGK